MRGHSLQVIGNKTEEDLIKWDNERVGADLKIKSLKDKKLGNSLYFINIMIFFFCIIKILYNIFLTFEGYIYVF